MRLVVQRVKEASVTVNNELVSKINQGFLVYLGISTESKKADITKYVNKLLNLRVFSDSDDKMNLSLNNVNGEVLVVSQFTLYASVKKGNRPSFINALNGDLAISFYNDFIAELSKHIKVKEGVFGADMQVQSINDGPVTIIIEDL